MAQAKGFEEFELRPELMQALEKMGFSEPTPIQQQAILPMLEGRDVIAKAPTGTGKTCSFGIPLLECYRPDCPDIQAVVVCPTRELCIQITDDLQQLAMFMPEIRVVALYGGQPINRQITALKKKPTIVVATPGRLLDHINRGTVWLGNVYTAVLDEADEMLKMGFIRDVRKIINATPGDTQVVLFSAPFQMCSRLVRQRELRPPVAQPILIRSAWRRSTSRILASARAWGISAAEGGMRRVDQSSGSWRI